MFKQMKIKHPHLNPTQQMLSRIYIQNDWVCDINISQNEKKYEINASLNAQGYHYTCSFTINEQFSLENMNCECGIPCAHIEAVLNKIESLNIASLPFSYHSSQLERNQAKYHQIESQRRHQYMMQNAFRIKQIIDNGKKVYQANINNDLTDEKMEIEPKVTYDSYRKLCTVNFKVGLQKKLVIKSISEFLSDVEENNVHTYGKNLSFAHSMNIFDEFSQKQIEFMKIIRDNRYNALIENHYYRYSSTIQRDIILEGIALDQFFQLYQDYDSNHFVLTKSTDKINIDVRDEEEFYTFKLNLIENLKAGNKHLYAFHDSNPIVEIKQYTLDEAGNALNFLTEFESNELYISKEDYPGFYKYILSPIFDYFDFTHLPEVQGSDYQRIRIYGDVDEQSQIFFKLIYLDENQNKKLGFNPDIMTNYQQDFIESMFKKYASHIDEKTHLAYFDLNEEKTYTFIQEEIDKLKEYAEIFISESLKRIGQKSQYHISVGVKIQNDLLEIDIESLEIPKNELSKVLDQYKRRKKFYRLRNGELIHLESPQLEEVANLMDQYQVDVKNMKNGHFELNKNRMFTLEDDMKQLKNISINRQDSFKETLEKFNLSENKQASIPAHYQNILRDYQKDGFQWMHMMNNYGFNGILADDMGLGKTLQVIALLESIDTTRPSLVVCPSSLIYNWEDEVHKFTDYLPVTCIVGKSSDRKEIIQTINNKHLYVTSYDYMRKDYELYNDTTFEYVILDEAQYIKNLKTKNAISVKQLHACHKIALSGTPIENSLSELWSIMDFLMPQYLFNYTQFRKRFENDIVKSADEKKTNQLKKMVTPFILRRNKKDVLKELPDKIETTQIIPFNEEENELYLANLASANDHLQEILKMEKVDSFQILALLTKLRQLCCEPRILFENIDQASSKMKACLDILVNAKENNQKVLLFSSFTSVFDLLEDELRERGISFFTLTGSTPKEERRDLVEQFQNGNVDVFLISLKAGGTGLNLTKAEIVIHFDPWWNVSAQNQATDRAYRIGQHSNVQVYKLVMKNSIEEKIVSLQEKKKELADLFVENNEGSISKMSKDEIRELFA